MTTAAAEGVKLDTVQSRIVQSVLELFQGKPSKENLGLWADECTFEDPLCIATGREQVDAQWYGLQKICVESVTEHCRVTRATAEGIEMDLRQRYVLRPASMTKTIESVVLIGVAGGGKIQYLQDKWNGELPDNSFVNFFRRANAKATPLFVTVPKE